MAPYYYGDEGDDDRESVGRRLLAALRQPEDGPDETAQAAPPMTMGQYRNQAGATDIGFKKRPDLPEEIDNVVAQAKQGLIDGGGGDTTPARMQQAVSMVKPQPTLGDRGDNGATPATSAGSPEPVTFAPPMRNMLPRTTMPAAKPPSVLDTLTSVPPITPPALGAPEPAPGVVARPPADLRRMTDMSPRPSAVSTLPPAPDAPVADPRRAAAIDAISRTSAPIPKTDAAGNTQPQYKMGLGRRILMGAAATLGHGVPGLAEVTSNPNDPNYIGPGAVNSRYTRDEATRQAQLKGATEQQSALDREATLQEHDFQNKNTQYRDEAKTAAQQDVLNERTIKDEAVNAERAKTNQVRQQAEDLKKSMQAPTFNSQTGKFMAGDATIAPKNNDEGWSWEIANGITTYDANGKLVKAGPYTRAAMSENKNNPHIHVHTGEGPKWSKVDAANIMAYARDHQIQGKDADSIANQFSKQQLDEALGRKPVGGETFVNPAERQEYGRRTSGIDRQIQKYEEDVRQNTEASASPGIDANSKATLDAMAASAQKQIDQLEGQKQKVEQEIVSRRPQTPNPVAAGRAQQPVTPNAPAPQQTGKPPAGNPNGIKKQNGQFYQYVFRKGNQKIGSDDGKTWFDTNTGQQLR